MRGAGRRDKAEVLATRMMDLGACKLCGPSTEDSMWPRAIVVNNPIVTGIKLAVVIS